MRRYFLKVPFAAACVVATQLTAFAGTAIAGTPVPLGFGTVSNSVVQVDFNPESMVTLLESQGFRVLKIEQTFLGRLRFLAQRREMTREIIVSRTTGAILRDTITAFATETPNGNNNPVGETSGTVQGNVGSVLGTVDDTVRDTTGGVRDGAGSALNAVGSTTEGLGL